MLQKQWSYLMIAKNISAMETATVVPKYIPLMQKPKCCAVGCLQMILYRNGYGLYDQEDLAIEFGVKIGSDDRHAFREDMPIMTEFNCDEGISTVGSVDKINSFFERSSIALEATAYPYASLGTLEELIADNLPQNNDIWIEYHSHEVHAGDRDNKRIHDALLESFDKKTGTAVLIDPKPGRRQRVTVPLGTLERSLSGQFGKELGIVVVRKTTP